MNKIVRYLLVIWIVVLIFSGLFINPQDSLGTIRILYIIRSILYLFLGGLAVYNLVKNRLNAENFFSVITIFAYAIFLKIVFIYQFSQLSNETVVIVKNIVRSIWYFIPIIYYILSMKKFDLSLKGKAWRLVLPLTLFVLVIIVSLFF